MLLQIVGAIYLIGVALAVGLYFIVNPFHAESFNPENIWRVLNILMAVGLVVALAYNFRRKHRVDAYTDEVITRRYFEANLAFYGTLAITILYLHQWFSLLAFGAPAAIGGGPDVLNHQSWVKWAVVDTLLPIVLGVTGFAMWRDAE